jgi:ribokinase
MFDIVTVGSATVDLFFKSKQLKVEKTEQGLVLCQQYDEKIDVEEFFHQSGGAGTNTAVGFSRLGLKTATIVEIGQDLFGQMVIDDLKREDVDTDWILEEEDEQTAVSALMIAEGGGRSVLTHRGASGQLSVADLPDDLVTQTNWIHVANISGKKDVLERLFEVAKAKQVGLSWNPGKPELELLNSGQLSPAKIECDILFLNKGEWESLVDIKYTLLEHIPYVAITEGKDGGQLHVKGHYTQPFKAAKSKTIQETGAGDAFATGFVAAHYLGRPPVECCEWGAQNAASVISHMGAKTGLLNKAEMKKRLA